MTEQGASALTQQDIRDLKSRLHRLRPAVVLQHKLDNCAFGNIDLALNSDELVKIRTRANNSEELISIAREICSTLSATLIQTMGYIIAIYRKSELNEQEIYN